MKKLIIGTLPLFFILQTYSQNIGIGTAMPAEKLDVIGNVRSGFPVSNTLIGTHPTFGNSYSAFWKNGAAYSMLTDGVNTFLNAPSASGGLYLRTDNINRVVISGVTGAPQLEVAGSGFQKIRVTSSDGGGCALEFAQAGRSWQISGGAIVSFDYGTDLSAILNRTIDINASTLVLEPYFDNQFGLGNASYRWNSVYATTGVVQTSDERLKKNIHAITYGINTLMQLKPVSYQWKDGSKDNRASLGFLAQDVLKVVPEAVYHDTKPKNSEKKDAKANVEDPYGMNYAELIPVLVRSIQEQQQMILELQKQIREIKKSGGRRN